MARSETQAVEHDGIFYFPGGLSRGLNPLPAHDTFESFDPETNEWTSLADMPDKRHHLLVAAWDGFIYVFGGLDERLWLPQDNLWRYSIEDDEWMELASMPTDLASGAAVTLDGSIFVIAGVGAARQTFEFDPVTGGWSTRAPLMEAREHIAAAVVDGLIYVSGGRWSEGELASVERYDPSLDEWQAVAPLAVARAGHAMVGNDGQLVAFGGEILGTRTALDSVELYDPETDRWTAGPPLPTTTHGGGAVAWAGTVYMIGGAPNAAQANATGDVYSWTP